MVNLRELSMKELATFNNLTLPQLKQFSRNLRDKYNITVQPYSYVLYKN